MENGHDENLHRGELVPEGGLGLLELLCRLDFAFPIPGLAA
jgi:hypothetical protein